VFGRAGGIVAPFVGGFFLSTHMPLQQLMIIAALPCIPTLFVVFGLGRLYSRFFSDTAPVQASAA
jgi:hypothetical protein